MKPHIETEPTCPTESDGEDERIAIDSWSLSVTNVPSGVFEDDGLKAEFENLFSPYGSQIERSFIYLKTFHRARVTFNRENDAIQAKGSLHGQTFMDCELGVFIVQRPSVSNNNNSNLKPPPLEKQFLISPPASPPVGWEQTAESHPVINYDLLTAVASLDTTEPYQLHACAEDAPSIVVHLCDEEDGVKQEEGTKFHPLKALPRDVTQTRRPERKS